MPGIKASDLLSQYGQWDYINKCYLFMCSFIAFVTFLKKLNLKTKHIRVFHFFFNSNKIYSPHSTIGAISFKYGHKLLLPIFNADVNFFSIRMQHFIALDTNICTSLKSVMEKSLFLLMSKTELLQMYD